jgi:hypothetical protein
MIGVPSEKLEIFQDEPGGGSVPESNPGSNLIMATLPLQEAFRRAEVLSADSGVLEFSMDRFADLSKEMIALISELSRSVHESENQLKAINTEIDLKKNELITLHAIDAAAVSMKQMEEAQQVQKEQLERLISDQHCLWEEEKERIAQEEHEFLENLKIQRRLEEEEYRRARISENQEMHRKFKQELQTVWQKAIARQEEEESKLLQREQIIIDKEREIALLIQALDAFLSQWEMRLNLPEAVSMDTQKHVAIPKYGSSRLVPIPLDDETASTLESVNEMALSLNQNMDNLHERIPLKQESTLLQFSFKKTVST